MFTNEELIVIMNITMISLKNCHGEKNRFSYLGPDVVAQYDKNIRALENLLQKTESLIQQ